MKYLFSGSVELTVDDKNRFRFPAKYKDAYTSFDSISGELKIEEVYILKLLNTNYLTVFPKDVAEKFIAQLQAKLYMNETNETKVAKLYLSKLEASKVDSQGRFVISQNQMRGLNIGKEIVIAGMGNKLEIWNKADYETYMNEVEMDLENQLSDKDYQRSELDNMVIGLD